MKIYTCSVFSISHCENRIYEILAVHLSGMPDGVFTSLEEARNKLEELIQEQRDIYWDPATGEYDVILNRKEMTDISPPGFGMIECGILYPEGNDPLDGDLEGYYLQEDEVKPEIWVVNFANANKWECDYEIAMTEGLSSIDQGILENPKVYSNFQDGVEMVKKYVEEYEPPGESELYCLPVREITEDIFSIMIMEKTVGAGEIEFGAFVFHKMKIN